MTTPARTGARDGGRLLGTILLLTAILFTGHSVAWGAFRFTSIDPYAGPSNPGNGFVNAICYANGSLISYNCGGTGYPSGGNMQMYFSGGNQAAVNNISGSPYLVYSAGGSATLQSYTTIYIGNYDSLNIDFGGATVIQTSGSAQTVTVNVFSDTGRTVLIGTNSVSVPSGVPTAVAVSGGTRFKSATIAFPSAIVWGANDFLLQATPAGPIATTGGASSVTAATATIAGTVNDNGAATAVSFQYGTTTGYGSTATSTPASVSAGAGLTSVSASLVSLACATTYHYRVAATSAAGSATGSDATFTTSACPNTAPSASSVAITGAAQFGQVLTGSYFYADGESDAENVSGAGTSYRFVRSTDNSVATAGDNVDVASGATGGASRTYPVVAADVGSYLFYCVTPRAATGFFAGAEVCSSATAAVTKAAQSPLGATATPASIAFNATSALGTTGGSGTGAVSYAVTAGGSFCSVSGSTLTAIGVGTCTVTATKAADADYNAATATVDVTVTKATQAIAFSPVASVPVGSTAILVATGGSSGNPVTFSSLTPSLCTVSGNVVAGAASGSCQVAADQAGDARYNAAPQVVRTVTVSQSPPRLKLSVSANPAKFRVPSRLAVAASGDFGPVEGFVEFRIGEQVVPGCAEVTIASGVATCESALLPLGVRWVVARYAGRGAYTAGESDSILLKVRHSQATRNRDTHDDGRASLFMERSDGGLYLTTVRGQNLSDGQELAAAGSGWRFVDFGDFDGDGRTDALLRSPQGQLEAWLLDGIGAVTKRPIPPLPAGATLVALGDFNGDGRTDLLLKAADGSLSARLMNGAEVIDTIALAGPGSDTLLAAIDLDGDGIDDLVLAHGSRIRLQPVAPGRAIPLPALDIAGPGEAFALVGAGDFDADGYADLVFAGDGTILVWRLGENGLVKQLSYALQPGWKFVEAVDFDGAMTDEFILEGPRGEAAVWSIDAQWRMASGTVFSPGGGWRFVQAADYDGNGDLDLLFESDKGELVAWLFERGRVVSRVVLSHPTAWRVMP
jgi:hypothetical protein